MVELTVEGCGWVRQRLAGLDPARPGPWPPFELGLDTERAAVLVPIVLAPEPFVLLTRRSAALRHHPGQVSFPGGRADPGDWDAVETALREAQEEIGLDPAVCDVRGRLPQIVTFNGRFSIVPVVALLPAAVRWRASDAEVAAVFGLPVSVLLDPDAPRRITEGTRAGSWSWPHPEEDIWGATARMLVDLAKVLRTG